MKNPGSKDSHVAEQRATLTRQIDMSNPKNQKVFGILGLVAAATIIVSIAFYATGANDPGTKKTAPQDTKANLALDAGWSIDRLNQFTIYFTKILI